MLEDSSQVENTQENTKEAEEAAELENADYSINKNPEEGFYRND